MAESLTQNQKRFADEYVMSGNGAEAYKTAYKNVKKDSTARANASRLLTNANVIRYIQERNKQLDKEKVADMQEVHEFWANVLRDEENSTSDRIRVSELIGKTNGAFLDRVEQTGDMGITVEWVGDD